ncbi:MAG TPA: DMT family transporter [Anaeromyxobacteraceae bacterium]|nr:DMT family transporter [Anaeromyxobacteraceae bacterium]
MDASPAGGGAARLRRLSPAARARVLLFLAAALFGLLAVLARIASIEGLTAPQVATVRFAVGTAISLLLFRVRPGTFRPVRKGLLVTRGVLGGLAALLYFYALALIPAGQATLLNNTFPVIAVAISYFTLNERPTWHLLLALAVTSVGVYLVLGGGRVRFELGFGQWVGIASAFLGAGAVTSIRALRATDNAPTIFFAFTLGGLVVSAPLSIGAWSFHHHAWIFAVAAGLVSFLAQLSMTEAYGALTVAEAAVWQQLTPVASFLWAGAVLGEGLSTVGMIGVALGIAGVVYGSVLGHRPPEPEEA